MVSSITSTGATQSLYATAPKKNLDETATTPSTVTTPEEQETAAAATQSAESAASARLGAQLSAQADASRVQRAVDESTPPPSGPPPADEASADTATDATSAKAPAGGAPAAAATSETTDTDYIAEADTNSDKTVSDEERLAYETKLRQQAEDAGTGATKASMKTDPVEALTAEVRATYGVDEAAEPAFNITA